METATGEITLKSKLVHLDGEKACKLCKQVRPMDDFNPRLDIARNSLSVQSYCQRCRSLRQEIRITAKKVEDLIDSEATDAAILRYVKAHPRHLIQMIELDKALFERYRNLAIRDIINRCHDTAIRRGNNKRKWTDPDVLYHQIKVYFGVAEDTEENTQHLLPKKRKRSPKACLEAG